MSLSDEYLLSTDSTFQTRIRAAMFETALAVAFESPNTANHQVRLAFAVICVNSPDTIKAQLSGTVATDANVIADATVGGTVTITSLNLVTQAALVTDAHIRSAIIGQWGLLT